MLPGGHYSCHPLQLESPDGILLTAVLADLYEGEAILQLAALRDSTSIPEFEAEADDPGLPSDLASGSPGVRDSILAVHGLSETQFDLMMEPWLAEPEALQKLYDRVLDRLSEARQSVPIP